MQVKVFEHEKMEKHPFLIRLFRVISVPVLNLIPARALQRLIKRSSRYGSNVIDRPGTTHSLEAMYTKEDKESRMSDSFWHNVVSQPKAVRNRLKIVELILEKEIQELKNKKLTEIQIYNIGGGSSRAIIKAVNNETNKSEIKIKVTTLDKDASALELGNLIAKKYQLDHLFTWIEDDARNIDKMLIPDSGDIVEMVGLLDYFNYEASVNLIKQIYRLLKPGGLFIVANVHPNPESKFVENVGWPKMYYKTTDEMNKILRESGFDEKNIDLHIEPLKVHVIALARK